jgi:hypothetical protein
MAGLPANSYLRGHPNPPAGAVQIQRGDPANYFARIPKTLSALGFDLDRATNARKQARRQLLRSVWQRLRRLGAVGIQRRYRVDLIVTELTNVLANAGQPWGRHGAAVIGVPIDVRINNAFGAGTSQELSVAAAQF